MVKQAIMLADKTGLREKGSVKKEKKKKDKTGYDKNIKNRLSQFGIGIKDNNNG